MEPREAGWSSRPAPPHPGNLQLEAFVLIKVLDAEGSTSWSYRTTNRLNPKSSPQARQSYV
jgi:hypothetical protein